VALASPVLELSTYALLPATTADASPRLLVRIVGVDPLQVAAIAPDLMPLPSQTGERTGLFAPNTVYLNAAARLSLGASRLQLQQGLHLQTATVAGSVRAGGGPLAVMDIAAAQDFFGKAGQLTRIDIRLQAGTDREAFVQRMVAAPGWQARWALSAPGESAARIANLSRAYRVNLTVLALIALFTGGFLVFSVMALSVTRRAQQFALLGVLGLTSRQRLQLVLLEAAALGVLGSALGIALGAGLAALALRLLGGDLGGGFLPVLLLRCNGVREPPQCLRCWGWRPRWLEHGGRHGWRRHCLRRKRSRAWAPRAVAVPRPGLAPVCCWRAPAWRYCHRWPVCRWALMWALRCCCWAALSRCPG